MKFRPWPTNLFSKPNPEFHRSTVHSNPQEEKMTEQEEVMAFLQSKVNVLVQVIETLLGTRIAECQFGKIRSLTSDVIMIRLLVGEPPEQTTTQDVELPREKVELKGGLLSEGALVVLIRFGEGNKLLVIGLPKERHVWELLIPDFDYEKFAEVQESEIKCVK